MTENRKYKSQSMKRPQSLHSPGDKIMDRNSQFDEKNHDLEWNHNNTYKRKESMKKKFLSIFKSNRKNSSSQPISLTNSENSSIIPQNKSPKLISQENSLNSDLSHNSIMTLRDTLSKSTNKRNSCKSTLESDPFDNFDAKDNLIYNKFCLNKLNYLIIKYAKPYPCSILKVPPTWFNKFGEHFSNNLITPFLSFIPGNLGIENHGNTCYINVISQCLAHIDLFAEYFTTKDFVDDIKLVDDAKRMKKTSNSPPDSLDIAVGFVYFLLSLWQNTYTPKLSLKFCHLLTNYKSEYSLDTQQDAHEYLLCILNLLHDNLTIPTSPASASSASSTESKELSFLYRHFRLYLNNEIICSNCNGSRQYQDEMFSLNLQLPIPNDNNVDALSTRVYLYYLSVVNYNQAVEKHAIEVDKNTRVSDIQICIAKRMNCAPIDILLLDINETGFGKLFQSNEKMLSLCQRNTYSNNNTYDCFGNGLYALFLRNQIVDVDALSTEQIISPDLKDVIYSEIKKPEQTAETMPFVRLIIVNVEKLIDNAEQNNTEHLQSKGRRQFYRFSKVMTIQASRKTGMKFLKHSLGELMCKYLNVKPIMKLPSPKLVIDNGYQLSDTDLFPLSDKVATNAINENLRKFGPKTGAFLTVTVVWPKYILHKLQSTTRLMHSDLPEQLNKSFNKSILIHHSVDVITAKHNAQSINRQSSKPNLVQGRVSITDCLNESLSTQDTWNCTQCHTSKIARNNMKISQPPDILILMLKRFNQQNQTSNDSSTSSTTYEDLSNSESTSFSDKYIGPSPPPLLVHKLHSVQTTNLSKQSNPNNPNRLLKRGSSNKSDEYLNKLECLVDYPLKDLDMTSYIESPDATENYKYDLLSVVNHRGNLHNGHYVAICKNGIDQKWRLYDDDRVIEITPADVVQPDAYILFYQRQKLTNENIAKSNSNRIHWSYRRLPFPNQYHLNHNPSPISRYTNSNPVLTSPVVGQITNNSRISSLVDTDVQNVNNIESFPSFTTYSSTNIVDVHNLPSNPSSTPSMSIASTRSPSPQQDSGAILLSQDTVSTTSTSNISLIPVASLPPPPSPPPPMTSLGDDNNNLNLPPPPDPDWLLQSNIGISTSTLMPNLDKSNIHINNNSMNNNNNNSNSNQIDECYISLSNSPTISLYQDSNNN